MVAQFISQPPTPKQQKFKNLQEFQYFIADAFIRGSGIDEELFNNCVEFHQSVEWTDGMDATTPIHDELGWYFTRFGHQCKDPIYAALLRNEDGSLWQAVVSIWDEEKQRPYRYLAPKGNGDRAFFPPIPRSIREKISQRYGVEVPLEGSFWEWVKDNPDLNRILTEGGKKTLSGLSLGYILIGLYGCNCGREWLLDENEQKDELVLIPDLQSFAERDTKWLLALDRDTKPKAQKSVAAAKNRLALLLEEYGCYSVDMKWKAEDGKGLDDLIVNCGSGALDASYQDAVNRLNKLIGKGDKKEKRKIPPADVIAKSIAEEYRDKLSFNNEISQWMRYEADYSGVWSVETLEFIESCVYKILDSKNIEGYNSFSYISNIVKILRTQLIERKWTEKSSKDFLPFQNGVLEIKTGKLLPHSPGYRLTWQLPREYNPTATNWREIHKFLDHLSSGNDEIKDLLLCYCNAVLKGRSDLQKFLHLIGLGGTGKGTFARLVVSLIGEVNTHTTTLEDWCGNNFEGANAYRKRLVLFPDEDTATGKLGKFLSLTGEDFIRAEEKGRKAFSFRYDGMVLVCSNPPVFTGDNASRVKRRVITVPCNNPVATKKLQSLEKVFAPELAAFTNYVLSLTDDHVTNVLRGLAEIPECTLEFWLNRMRVDSLADWLNDKLIYDPTALTPVGCDRNEGADGSPIVTLFGNYSTHCKNSGNQGKSSKTFSPDLVELCNSVLGWNVKHKTTNTGKFICGIRLRVPGQDDLIPTHEVFLERKIKSDGSGDGSGDGSEALQHKESGESDESVASLIEDQKKNNQLDLTPQTSKHPNTQLGITEHCSKIVNISADELPLNPSLVSQSPSGQGFDPSLDSSLDSSLNLTASDVNSQEVQEAIAMSAAGIAPQLQTQAQPKIEVGDRIYCYPTDRHAENKWKVQATVTAIEYVKGSSDCEFFNGCEVEYCDKKYEKKTAKIAGGLEDWILGWVCEGKQ
ncbi:DUF3854 domain-containing protein [Nostoc sp. CCY0012]|uniref:DUF3854 domain-containing protein n=1 Tax=Nostoc sp. CCY0012 TaxID=1056123 RepID=UPI0039C72A89